MLTYKLPKINPRRINYYRNFDLINGICILGILIILAGGMAFGIIYFVDKDRVWIEQEVTRSISPTFGPYLVTTELKLQIAGQKHTILTEIDSQILKSEIEYMKKMQYRKVYSKCLSLKKQIKNEDFVWEGFF